MRHTRTFSVADVFGNIIDRLVPLQGYGLFPSNCFEITGRGKDGLSIVINDEDETIILKCTVDGIVLECDMLAEPPITSETVQGMYSELVRMILPMYEGGDKINRLGIVHQYQVSPFENSAIELFSKLFKVDLKGYPDDILFRFGLKNPTSEAIFDPTVKTDYKNVIFNLTAKKENDRDKGLPSLIDISIDYQTYFEPVRTLKDISTKDHLKDATSYIEKHLKTSEFNFQPSTTK